MKQQEMSGTGVSPRETTETLTDKSARASDESVIDWVDRINRASYRRALRQRFVAESVDRVETRAKPAQ